MSVIYVNKPKGITSFDVCFKLRKVFSTKKIGHTGTLDPNATGVMVVLVENATKANQFLVVDSKTYIAEIKIGIETDTLDIDGKIIKEEKCCMPSKEAIEETLKKYVGSITQIPPMTSAIKVGGKKLYEYQRQNKEVEIPSRQVEIYEIQLLDINESSFTIECSVSSGTYIRSLARDILKDLGIIGTLSELKRTKVDNISLDECDDLDDILNGNFNEHTLYEILSRKYETIHLNDVRMAINGRRMKFNSQADKLLVVSTEDECIAIYEKDGEEYRCLRGLR